MSRLQELIDELCPDGVEYKALSELFDIRNGYTPSKKNPAFWEGGTHPWFVMEDIRRDGTVLNESAAHITDEALKRNGLFPANSIIVATSATIGVHALVTVDFLCNQRFACMTIKEKYADKLDIRYVHQAFFALDRWCLEHVDQGNFATVNSAALKAYRIPVPPIEVQREVVRILDSFQELDDALTAEIEAREKQYSILTRRLLSREYLETVAGGPIVQKPLKEIALVGSSKRVLKRDLVDAGIPFFRGTEVGLLSEGSPIDPQLFLTEETYASVVSASGKPLVGDLLLPSVNEAGKIWMVDTDDAFYLKDARVLWVHTGSAKEEVDCRYMRYALSKSLVDNYRILASGSQFAELKISSLETAPILLPPFGVQSMVADKLDDARALLQDRTIGLPAEREARRKQFEHYRDRLLTFPEKVA